MSPMAVPPQPDADLAVTLFDDLGKLQRIPLG